MSFQGISHQRTKLHIFYDVLLSCGVLDLAVVVFPHLRGGFCLAQKEEPGLLQIFSQTGEHSVLLGGHSALLDIAIFPPTAFAIRDSYRTPAPPLPTWRSGTPRRSSASNIAWSTGNEDKNREKRTGNKRSASPRRLTSRVPVTAPRPSPTIIIGSEDNRQARPARLLTLGIQSQEPRVMNSTDIVHHRSCLCVSACDMVRHRSCSV